MSQIEDVQVKIMGVSGSPQKGATQFSVREALKAAAQVPGVTVDFIDLKAKKINFCIHCNRCVKKGCFTAQPLRMI